MTIMKQSQTTAPKNMISEYIADYLSFMTASGHSRRSINNYRITLNRLNLFLDNSGIDRVQNILPTDLDHYRADLINSNFKPASISSYLYHTKAFFAWLEQEQVIFINPAQDLFIPKTPKALQHVPTEKDVMALLAQPDIATSVGVRDRAIIEVLYATGARAGELVSMDLGDVNLPDESARLMGKGSKERVVPLGRHAVKWLSRYIATYRKEVIKTRTQAALFLNEYGRRLHYLTMERAIVDYSKKAGLPTITPHCLRRACATHMANNGAHPSQIQLLLGHESLSTLSRYIHTPITDIIDTHQKGTPGQ